MNTAVGNLQKRQPLFTVHENHTATYYATVPVHALLSTHYGWEACIDGEWVKQVSSEWIHKKNHLFVNLRKTFLYFA